MAREYEITGQIFELPAPEQFAISRPAELVDGLGKSEKAEDQGEWATSIGFAAWLTPPGSRTAKKV